MPRPPRIHIEKGLYFVTTRGDHGGELFKDEADREEYLELLGKYKQQYGFKLFCYVLMSTYTHLLIELIEGTTISDIMHVVNSTYTKYFNGRHQKRGHLFQERFKAVLIEKENYLLLVIRYMHLVPCRARLVKEPQDYKWSSQRLYLSAEERGVLRIENERKEVLRRFSLNADEQLKLYRQFMGSAAQEELARMQKKLQRTRMLGSKAFVERIKALTKEGARREKEEGQKAWAGSRARKIFILAGSGAILILSGFALFLYWKNLGLRNRFDRILRNKEVKFSEELSVEKEKLRKDLEEKYNADIVSYEAMKKRLEIEKKKAKEMRAAGERK